MKGNLPSRFPVEAAAIEALRVKRAEHARGLRHKAHPNFYDSFDIVVVCPRLAGGYKVISQGVEVTTKIAQEEVFLSQARLPG